eukprot:753926-Hanusia_phi.AAC.1
MEGSALPTYGSDFPRASTFPYPTMSGNKQNTFCLEFHQKSSSSSLPHPAPNRISSELSHKSKSKVYGTQAISLASTLSPSVQHTENCSCSSHSDPPAVPAAHSHSHFEDRSKPPPPPPPPPAALLLLCSSHGTLGAQHFFWIFAEGDG